MGTSIKSDESVLALLRHFKDDDGRVALLVKELEELSNRVQTADLASDPRLAQGRRGASAGARLGADGPDGGAHAPRGGPSGDSASASRTSSPATTAAAAAAVAAAGPGWSRASGGGSMSRDAAGGARMSPLGSASGGAFASAVRRVRHAAHSSAEPSLTGEAEAEQGQGPQAAAVQGDQEDGVEAFGPEGVSATGRVEDAALPVPPQDLSRPLPVPPGGHAWEALQAAANDNVRHFDAAAAKMGWKKWALTKAHSALLVSLFWWVVAAAFRADHPLSRPVQDFTLGHFCRHYVSVVLRLRGRARDHYQQVWIDTMAAAALYLLAEVFPRSSHKFDDGLRALITKQLRLWTAGALPADMHPSAHADAHSAAPAAFAVAAAAAELAAGQGRKAAFAKAEEAAARAAGPAPSLPSFSGPSFMYAGMGAPPAAPRGPVQQSLRRSVKSHNAVQADGAEDRPGAAAAAAAAVAAAIGSQTPQGFVTSKPSPVLARMLAGGGGVATGTGAEAAAAAAASAPPVVKGLLKNSVGGTLARLHRALDEDSEEDLSYKRHASAASAATSAAGAVAAYEAGRRAAAAEAAAARRGLVEARAAIDAKQRAVVCGAGGGSAKALSDRLSGYIQNDVDRLLAGLPTSTEPGHTAELPRYVRHTASSGAAAAGAGPAAVGAGSASVIKPARLMAPLYEMRRVEGNIRSALAAGRHSSTDTAARVAARAAERAAAAAADWRPLAGYPVGTKDTRRRKMAATVLYGLDLDSYT